MNSSEFPDEHTGSGNAMTNCLFNREGTGAIWCTKRSADGAGTSLAVGCADNRASHRPGAKPTGPAAFPCGVQHSEGSPVC
ncbi:hypothetical protein GCM10028799_02470 [Kribbella italica]